MAIKSPYPKEGQLFKTFFIDEYVFELRYGYYAEFERKSGEPVIIYPDLIDKPLYTNQGQRIVTAIQDPCEHYKVPNNKIRDESCSDCLYYANPNNEIGICQCENNTSTQPNKEATP